MTIKIIAALICLFLGGIMATTDVYKSVEVAGVIIMFQVLCCIVVFENWGIT